MMHVNSHQDTLVEELPVRRTLSAVLEDATNAASEHNVGPVTIGYPVQEFPIMTFPNASDTQMQRWNVTLFQHIKATLCLLICLMCVVLGFHVSELWYLTELHSFHLNP